MSRCPSAQQLEHLLDEQLTDADRQTVGLHVSDCAACQAALERLTAADTPSLSLHHPAARSAATPFLTRLKEMPAPAARAPARTRHAAGSQRRPPSVPGFEIVRELGRGGMGVVYEARQVGLNRLVALKVILAGAHAGPKDRARFRQEAEAVARLHHPNIVQIHGIGEADGVPYLVLELVAAGNLVQRLRGNPQPLEPAARLVATLARTVHSAHQRGIVHRDLKPANILLASVPRGEDSAELLFSANEDGLETGDFSPKITDFGLAKRLDDRGKGTYSGEIAGTPSYMAPEQASGQSHRVGPAADVYSLGAILYEMLTGRPPFKGATALDTVVQVLHEEPVRPSGLRPSLPRDLETICLKCLAKDPARRYASSDALADDLVRFLKGKPILARPVGRLERAWKWARRRPVTAALLGGMFASAILGFAGVTWQWQEAAQARDIAVGEKRDKEAQRLQAETARAEAIAERGRAELALYFSRIAQAQLQWRVNNVFGALESLARCRPLPDQEDRRSWEWHYLRGLFHSDLFTLRHGQAGSGGGAAFHPDGQTIAAVIGGHAADDDAHPGEVRVWDARTGAVLRTLRAPATAHRLVFRPDGARLALATTDGAILIWDTATGKELRRTPPDGHPIPSLAFSPDGSRIALARAGPTSKRYVVEVCNADSGQVLHVLRGHTGRVQSVAFHPDGRRLASGDADATVKVWDGHTGTELLDLRGHKSPVYGVAFSPDGALLASGSSNGNLRIWDLAAGRPIQSLTSQSGAVLANCFSPDGRYLAYGGGDGTVRVWDVESGVSRVVFRGHAAPVESVHFSPDGQRVVSSSPAEAAVKVWDLTRHPEHATFARVRGRAGEQIQVRDLTGRLDAAVPARSGPDLEALAFHADGKHLVSVAMGGELEVWDATSGVLRTQRSLPMCDELVTPAVLAVFNADGTRLAGRAREDWSLVKAWDVAGGATVAFRGHTMPVHAVRFSRDGTHLVTCACDTGRADRPHEIKVWDAARGVELASLTGHGLLHSAAFSADGRWVAAGTQDGDVLLIDWAGARRVVRLGRHQSAVAAVAFSGTGRLLASAGVEDRMLKLWDLDGFDPARDDGPPPAATLTAPPFLCDLAFSPDGQRLAGISRDVVKLWDVATRHEVLSLRGAPQRHWDPAFNPRVAFSPDGQRLVGTNWNESISMWDAAPSADGAAVLAKQAARRQAADARAAFWHLEEAEDCRDHHNLPAARFHLQRLGATPLPAPLQARKDRLALELRE